MYKDIEHWSFEVPQKFEIPYKYSVGAFLSKFFVELRDKGKILGSKCSGCGKVYMPPHSVCAKCYAKITDWVELGHEGTLLAFTVVNYHEPFHPRTAPFAFGLIRLDGADTGFVHFVNEVDLNSLKKGMRVRAVLKEKREGSILDIQYFRLV